MGKGHKPVSYEEAHAPHHIAHRKGWLSLHTGERTVAVWETGAGCDVRGTPGPAQGVLRCDRQHNPK